MSVQAAPAISRIPRTIQKSGIREIGPATMGGRIDDFAVVERNPTLFTWARLRAVFGKQPTMAPRGNRYSIRKASPRLATSRSRHPTRPCVGGTGEPNNRQSSSWATARTNRSTAERLGKDGLDSTRQHRANRHSSKNPDVVYVAALGRLWARIRSAECI